jgi:hypothetical protein
MRTFFILVFICSLVFGCKADKKPDTPTAEETAVDALPENIGDKNAPTAIKALKGAKEVKKQLDQQRKEDSKVLEETN